MFGLFNLFKSKSTKQAKKQYKLADFSKRRIHNNKTQVYHAPTNEWIYWHLIVSDVTDENDCRVEETDLHYSCVDVTGNQSDSSSSATSSTSGVTHDGLDHVPTFSSSSNSSDQSSTSSGYSSGYSSGSSYDSSSSSSSSSSSCSGSSSFD